MKNPPKTLCFLQVKLRTARVKEERLSLLHTKYRAEQKEFLEKKAKRTSELNKEEELLRNELERELKGLKGVYAGSTVDSVSERLMHYYYRMPSKNEEKKREKHFPGKVFVPDDVRY